MGQPGQRGWNKESRKPGKDKEALPGFLASWFPYSIILYGKTIRPRKGPEANTQRLIAQPLNPAESRSLRPNPLAPALPGWQLTPQEQQRFRRCCGDARPAHSCEEVCATLRQRSYSARAHRPGSGRPPAGGGFVQTLSHGKGPTLTPQQLTPQLLNPPPGGMGGVCGICANFRPPDPVASFRGQSHDATC